MLRTLLVDDEFLIRELLKDSIKFNELGFEVVGEAEDGIEALRKVQELAPQLVILDINIPFMNGIELSRVIRVKFPSIKIIILTGHGEFEYAREFIKIGVSDYLLKPIDPISFSEILLQLKGKVEAEVNQKLHLEKLEKDVESSSSLLRKQFLVELLDANQFSETEIENKLLSFNILLASQKITLFTIEIDGDDTKANGQKSREVSIYELWNMANRCFSDLGISVTTVDMDKRLVCITNAIPGIGTGINNLFDTLKKEAAQISERTLSIGISSTKDGYFQLPVLYQESIFALQEKFYNGKNTLKVYPELTGKQRSREPFKITEIQTVLVFLRAENRDGFIRFLDTIRNEMIGLRPENDIVFAAYSEIYTEVIKYIWENNLTGDEIIPESGQSIQFIRFSQDIYEINNRMIQLFDSVLAKVKNNSKSRSAQLVEKARVFIEGNYWKPDLTIEEVSERIFINPSYLSKVFKRDMKTSMIEFLTDLRLKKAKETMDAPADLHIGEIASKVGYNDPFYFSKLFKKTYGVSPSKYMERKHH